MYLNCHSYYSLRYGTIPVNELVDLAEQCNVKSLALTDINCVTGIYDFALMCHEKNIKPIAGVEFRNGNDLLFIGLATNFKGIGEMCRLITKHDHEKTPLPYYAEFSNVIVIYPFEQAPALLKDNEYIGVRPDQLVKLYKDDFKRRIAKMVILQPVTFRTADELNLHKILRAIDHNIVYTKLTQKDKCLPIERMIPVNELMQLYKDYPQIIKNTENILETCVFDFDFKAPKNKKHYTGSSYSDIQLLRTLAYEGMQRRYGKENREAILRIEKELEVVHNLDFAAYFLINWDIVRFSTNAGFLHVGRGSGANSIISYCLGITDICPIELNLYFERFLNASRSSPPDFDIDWGHKNRDAVLTYIFKRWGENHVGFCGTISQFKFRSKIREIGKVFGLPKEEMDELVRVRPDDHESNKVISAIHKYGGMLENYPNQRSMHSCGVLISDEPITNYTALEMMPKGFPIVQFDMHIAEDIGFEKFDILSQRGISTIDETVDLVKKNRGITVNIRDVSISKNKPELNERLGKGTTLGCFYIESPAMRGLMRRIGKLDYVVLVIASSIIRPGVAKSGMMGEYVHRHNKPGSWEFLHDVFRTHLFETHGIMVFQEDVIKIGIHYGGLDGNDADILRRAISGKKRSIKEMERIKMKFFSGAVAQGHSEELTKEIYGQMENFAGFSFCKAHSASYAVESYMSLYLKHYYPIEFMIAAINNEGGFYRTEVYIHEARRSGATIQLPCINKGVYDSSLHGTEIMLGFKLVKSISFELIEQIIYEREKNGIYTSLDNFISRIHPGIENLKTLIFVGAFRFTGQAKGEMVLKSRLLLSKERENNGLLFYQPTKEIKLPEICRTPFEDAFDELENIGFFVSLTPFELLKVKSRGNTFAKDLVNCDGKKVKMVAYLISTKQVPTKQGDMYFGTWIDVHGDYFDTAHFQACLKQYAFRGGGCYVFEGIVKIDYHFPTITVTRMEKLPYVPDPRFADQEDYNKKIHLTIREDQSTTERAPYPNPKEAGFKRFK